MNHNLTLTQIFDYSDSLGERILRLNPKLKSIQVVAVRTLRMGLIEFNVRCFEKIKCPKTWACGLIVNKILERIT